MSIEGTMENFLRKFAEKYGFENVSLKFESGSDKGDNFVGIVSKLTISGEFFGAPSALRVVVKSAPTGEKTRENMPTRKLFLREMFAYTDIFPDLERFQEELNEKERFRFVKCYTVNTENLNELLVMEDLMLQSYRMHKPRLATLDFDHLSVALTVLAKFHALSFVLQERDPKLFKKLTAEATDDIFDLDDGIMKDFVEKASETSMKALPQSLWPFAKDTFNNLKNLLKPQKYSVLCHGDYWKNNILFKYQSGKPVSACPLDYQLVRYASPVTDIAYLIFLCSTQELRRRHFDSLISWYHEALGSQLKRFSLDVERVFPRTAYMDEVKRVGSFGLSSAIFVLMLMTCASDEIPDPAEVANGSVAAASEDSESFKLYKERIRGVAEDSLDYGFIDI